MEVTESKRKKIFTFILIDLAIILAIVLYFGFIRPHFHKVVKIDGIFIENPKKMNDFRVFDSRGKWLTRVDLQDRWSFLFFGFTHCAQICPTTLAALSQMYQLLQQRLPAKLLPQIIFISVDPERDSLSDIKKYLNRFNQHFIGGRVEKSALPMLEKQFAITSVQVNDTITHTPEVILINPEAEVQAYFVYPQRPEQIAQDYQAILNFYAKGDH